MTFILLDALSKLWDDFLKTRSVYLIVLLGFVIVLYKIYLALKNGKESQIVKDKDRITHEKVSQTSSYQSIEKAIEDVRENVKEGETEVAIKLLVKYIKNLNEDDVAKEKFYDDVIQISSRFYSLSRQKYNGLISNDDFIENINQISNSILTLLKKLSKKVKDEK